MLHPFGDAEEHKGEETCSCHHTKSECDVLWVRTSGVGHSGVREGLDSILIDGNVVCVKWKQDQ